MSCSRASEVTLSSPPSTNDGCCSSDDEYWFEECTHCQTNKSPCWRIGPTGERLCNACGLYTARTGLKRDLALTTKARRKRRKYSKSINNSNNAYWRRCDKKMKKKRSKAEEVVLVSSPQVVSASLTSSSSSSPAVISIPPPPSLPPSSHIISSSPAVAVIATSAPVWSSSFTIHQSGTTSAATPAAPTASIFQFTSAPPASWPHSIHSPEAPGCCCSEMLADVICALVSHSIRTKFLTTSKLQYLQHQQQN